jgi:hypothetical protein
MSISRFADELTKQLVWGKVWLNIDSAAQEIRVAWSGVAGGPWLITVKLVDIHSNSRWVARVAARMLFSARAKAAFKSKGEPNNGQKRNSTSDGEDGPEARPTDGDNEQPGTAVGEEGPGPG